MTDKDIIQETRSEDNTSGSPQKKTYNIKDGLKSSARQIIFTALLLAITAVGALVTLSAGMSEIEASKSVLAVFLGAVSLIGWIAITVLSLKNKDRTESLILAVLFVLNIVGFIGMMLWSAGSSGDTAQAASGEASIVPVIIFTLIALPYFSAYSLFEAVGLSAVVCMAVFSIAVIAVSAWNYIRLAEKRKKDDIENSKIGYIFSYFDGSEGKDGKKDRW